MMLQYIDSSLESHLIVVPNKPKIPDPKIPPPELDPLFAIVYSAIYNYTI